MCISILILCVFISFLIGFWVPGIFQSEKAKMRKAASLSNKPKNEVADFGRHFGLADSPFDEENNSQGM